VLGSSVGEKTVAWTSGVLMGGLVAGLLWGTLSAVVPTQIELDQGSASLAWWVSVLLAVAADLRGIENRLPQASRQVAQRVATAGAPGAFVFGFEMGTGMRTWTSSFLPYVVLTASLVLGLLPAIIAGIAFGLGRVIGLADRLRVESSRARSASAAGLALVSCAMVIL